jgi:O-methyltransferase involved in polyketide biosynthesis
MNNSETRNFNAISPSAKEILLLKGITNIPFAREAAELISSPEAYQTDNLNKDLAFWKRVVHFEARYWSIDQLLSELEITNILELSSGFSFRGLDMVRKKKLHYIDTDLPNLVEQKKEFIRVLQGKEEAGKLETRALNALDEENFLNTVKNFSPGPIAIVNEGLLMYLNETEKEKLCRIIRKVLKQRGGYWITGDIYVKSTLERVSSQKEDRLKELVDQQRIEDNMFDSFDLAARFFKDQGFVIDREAIDDYSKIVSVKYLFAQATETQSKEMQQQPNIRKTWRLKPDDNI